MEIFKLFGSVFVDTAKAEESLSKTDKKAEGVGKQFLKGVGTVAKWGAAAVGAAAAVGTAMVASAKDAASNLDVIDKASQRMNISAESYQELAHAAGLCGVEMSTMEKAAKKLEGTGLNMDDALAEIYALTDAEERSAKAAELFGDAVAYQMSPMLNASAEDMAAMRQEANDLGLVMSSDAVKAGADMNDAFTKIEEAVGSVKNQIGAAFMPMLMDLLNWVLAHMPEIQAGIKKVTDFTTAAIEKLTPLIEALAPIVSIVFDKIAQLWETILKPILVGIIDFLTGVFTGNWEQVFQGLANIVKGIFGAIVELVKIPINNLINMLNIVIDGFNKIKLPDWVPGIGGKGLDIPHIPALAKGGDITTGGAVLVGERGPELLDLPRGARVTPLSQAGTATDNGAILDALLAIEDKLTGLQIVLDTGTVVGELAPAIDGALGDIYARNERWTS